MVPLYIGKPDHVSPHGRQVCMLLFSAKKIPLFATVNLTTEIIIIMPGI